MVVVELHLSLGADVEQMTGIVHGPAWQAGLAAGLTGFSPANPASHAGAYTLILPGSDAVNEPGGDGYGAANLTGNGLASFSGMLADGTKVAHKVTITRSGHWPLYVGLYSGKGSILGWLGFEGSAPTNRLSGTVSWVKPAQASAKLYSSGLALNIAATGSRYLPPAAGSRILDLTKATLTLSGGNLPVPIVNEIEVTPDNKILNLSENKLTLTIAPASGLLTGNITDSASGRSINFKGVVLQTERLGAGYFLGTNQSGWFRLTP